MIEKSDIKQMAYDFDEWLRKTEDELKADLKEYSQYHLDAQTNSCREQLGVHFGISEKFRAIFEDVLMEA